MDIGDTIDELPTPQRGHKGSTKYPALIDAGGGAWVCIKQSEPGLNYAGNMAKSKWAAGRYEVVQRKIDGVICVLARPIKT